MDRERGGIEVAAGSSVGQYRIIGHLGSGGMGTVYKAADTRLGREVALKLLRPELLGDADAIARMEREARTLASLNHPAVATLYGFEERDGVRFLAMEYVPGPTLAERLRHGPLAPRDALLVGRQIAEALESAHAKGIVHRDLKPANLKVSDTGAVKVLDFGLAKWVEQPAAATESTATVAADITGRMTIVGTAAYMAPEQASGKALDARADIWAFGCVLYEALAGKRAFAGATTTEVLAAVLQGEPDWAALPAGTPPAFQMLLRRCLRKDPNRRLRDIGDARIELEDLLTAPAEAAAVRRPASLTRRTAISALSGALAGAAGMGVFAIGRYRGGVPRGLAQYAVTAPQNGVFVPSFNKRIAISPDGRLVAFGIGAGGSNPEALYLRFAGELESRRLKEIPAGGVPFFSPDARYVGFITTGSPTLIRKLALSGGGPVTICPHAAFAGATWAENDIIYWINVDRGLLSVPAAGGDSKPVAQVDFDKGERQYKYPCALPGSKAVLAVMSTASTATFDEGHIVAISTATGTKKILLEGGTHPRYVPGHLLYAHDGKILAVRFDPGRLAVVGQPFTAVEGIQMSRNTGVANFDVSASGDLAYISGSCEGGARTVVWVDRAGRAETVPLPAKSYLHPRLSPDARRVAIEVEGPSHDLYVYDFDRAVLANITTDGVSHWPIWSPDGTELAYRSGPMGHFTLWRVPADRSRAPRQLPAEGVSQSAESWAPEGRAIVYTATAPGAPPTIMVAHLEGNHKPEQIDQGKAAQGSPKFSPDGRWLAYCSAESGKAQVYVQAFPGPGAKIQLSNDGGTDPVWKRNGGELYYRNGDSMMAVAVSTAPAFHAARPRELWSGHYSHGMSTSCGPPGTTSSNYDVTADGQRFLMIKDDDQDRAASKQIVVALGWAEELSRIGRA